MWAFLRASSKLFESFRVCALEFFFFEFFAFLQEHTLSASKDDDDDGEDE
jgi:hypothetical protein